MQFEYWFYTAWCKNQGGGIVVPMSDENYHELMDTAESIVDKDGATAVIKCTVMVQDTQVTITSSPNQQTPLTNEQARTRLRLIIPPNA